MLALLVFLIDQLTKFWVVQRFGPGETLPIIPGFFNLTYVRNPGAAFGIFAYHTSFFIGVSVLMILIILVGRRFLSTRYITIRLALALQLGGALGNLIDRVRTGYVIDFLDFSFWPVFNFADVALVAGIILVIISFMLQDAFEPRK